LSPSGAGFGWRDAVVIDDGGHHCLHAEVWARKFFWLVIIVASIFKNTSGIRTNTQYNFGLFIVMTEGIKHLQ
jgi:hypothetical protein